jgi:hemerythrin
MSLRCCIVCRAEASSDLQLQYCAVCKSALYCSEACQKIDWRKQHKKMCKLLNVGHGGMQVRSDSHTSLSVALKEQFDTEELNLDEEEKRFFKLFEESTFEGSRTAARKMKEIAKRQTKGRQMFLLFLSLHILVRSSDSEMLSWPNSPLLVMLQFVDPDVLSGTEDEPLQEGEGEERVTPLHIVARLASPRDYFTHENQLILAKQLIERGANVDAVSISDCKTPLHNACSGDNVTNLDFIELLLKAGADPNAKDYMEMTPLMMTMTGAPGAAKFLLNWPATDVNITISRMRFLDLFRMKIKSCSDQIAISDNPNQAQDQFLLQQMREVEEMMVARRRR